MDVRFQRPSEGVPFPALPLLVVLLATGLTAGLFTQTAWAQQQKQDLTLRFLADDYYTEITAGETQVLLLEVRNIGSQAIRDIELSSLPPEGWTIDLEPDRIAALNPADSQVIEVTVQTPSRSGKERHEIVLRADSASVHRAISAWITVEPPAGRWLWVGGILAVVVVAGFVVIFVRFGRD
jgi:uncharacterized membrane protein